MVAVLKRYKWILLLLSSAFSIILLQISFLFHNVHSPTEEVIRNHLEERTTVSKALAPYFEKMEFPNELNLKLNAQQDENEVFNVEYTMDSMLQSQADKLFNQYKPDYGAIFMMDAETGKVLVYSSYQKDSQSPVNLIKRASYPAASVFKIVTATAAIDKAGLDPGYKIQFNGGNWTLYKKNVMLDKINRWTRTVSLREAFAKSMNTPFGKMTLNSLSPSDLEEYSSRFLFNQPIPADFPVDVGTATIPTEKNFQLTEAASGFNKINRMSPVQGAMIAASVINNGSMIVPYMVNSLRDKEGNIIYRGEGLERGNVMSTKSAEKIREMMSETLVTGTSRKTFYNLVRNKKYQQIEMGGKTGHLTGDDPQGRVDWFVGYASDGEHHIAIAALTVSKKYWTVKSSHLGQTLFKKYFDPQVQVAANHRLGPVNN